MGAVWGLEERGKQQPPGSHGTSDCCRVDEPRIFVTLATVVVWSEFTSVTLVGYALLLLQLHSASVFHAVVGVVAAATGCGSDM